MAIECIYTREWLKAIAGINSHRYHFTKRNRYFLMT